MLIILDDDHFWMMNVDAYDLEIALTKMISEDTK